jgi:hypothetical protein
MSAITGAMGGQNPIQTLAAIARQQPQVAQQIATTAEQVAKQLGIPVEVALQLIMQGLLSQTQQAPNLGGRNG